VVDWSQTGSGGRRLANVNPVEVLGIGIDAEIKHLVVTHIILTHVGSASSPGQYLCPGKEFRFWIKDRS
jgi:hypothetical protein